MTHLGKLSIQELMEIAKNPIKEEDEFKHLPPVRRFIVSDKIQHGDYKIPAILIYDRYARWANKHKLEIISQVKFFKELALYFNKIRISEGFAYIMSPEGFNLSPDYLHIVNNRKRNSNGKNKKNKKERQD